MKKISEKSITLKDPESGYEKKMSLKQYRLENGVVDSFFVNNNNDSVQILPVTKDGEVILVKQFRPNNEKEHLELPGGGLDKDEDPKLGASRELMEETMYGNGDMHLLFSSEYSPYDTGKRYVFVCYNCEPIKKSTSLDDNEFLSIKKVTMDVFLDLATNASVRGFDCVYPAAVLIKRLYGINIFKNI